MHDVSEERRLERRLEMSTMGKRQVMLDCFALTQDAKSEKTRGILQTRRQAMGGRSCLFGRCYCLVRRSANV